MKCDESDRAFAPRNEDEALIFAEEAFRVETQTKIHELMVEKGLTKQDLAKRLKVSGARISQVFSDRANLTLRNIARIFFAMGEVPRIETTPVENANWILSANAGVEALEPALQGFASVTADPDQAYGSRGHAQAAKPLRGYGISVAA
ncbi:MAG TPA: helix-turn-helix domain-containing protein [Polyangiaceae bacterium]|nr:helix-turn-helix domain-containing protein [Polyangiaceae bacterium]